MFRYSSRQPLSHKVRARLLMLVAVLVLLMTAWIVIGRQLMLLVPEYRTNLEHLVEERINTPLEIRSLHGFMDGAAPVFVFEDVRLPSTGTAAPLRIERVELTVDILSSLSSRTLRARQLVVSGLDLDLSVDTEGKVTLTGLDGLGSRAESERASPLDSLLDLIYRQKRLVVENVRGTVSLADLPDIDISQLDLAMVSSGTSHRLSLRAQTVERPVELELRLRVEGDPHRLADLNGEGWVRVSASEADPWINAVLAGRAHVADLAGSAEFWLSLRRGEVSTASTRMQFDSISVDAPSMTRPLQLKELALAAQANRWNMGYVVQLAELRAHQKSQQQSLTLGPTVLAWNGERGEALRWRAASRDLDVTSISRWITGLPLKWPDDQAPLIERVRHLQPAGQVESLSLEGGKGVERFSARFESLGSQAHERIPGADGVSGWVAGDLVSGVVRLDSDALSLDLPLLFRWPLRVKGEGAVRWERQENAGLLLQTGWLKAQNKDARGQAAAEILLMPDQVPHLSLLASLSEGDAHAAPRYIPLNRLPEPVADWLSAAFVGGRVERGALLYEGPVKIDPDRQQDRTLQVAIKGRSLQLHFLPGWPLVKNLDADTVIDGREIRARQVSGSIFSARLKQATVDIPDYDTGEAPQLVIFSGVEAPANDMQKLFRETPLRDQLPEELTRWDVDAGTLRGNALLYIPLGVSDKPMQVLVNAGLGSASVSNPSRQLALTDVSGDINFSLSDGVQAKSLKANLWGRPLDVSVRSRNLSTQLYFAGSQPVSALQNWLDAGWLGDASGELAFKAAMRIPDSENDLGLDVEADLSRVNLSLPSPLGRKAGAALEGELKLSVTGPQQDIWLAAGPRFEGALRLLDGKVERGQFLIGETGVKMPAEPGVWVRGRVAELDVGSWVDYFTAASGEELGDDPFPLKKVSINTQVLNLFDLPVENALVSITPEESRWRYVVDSDELAAFALVPDRYQARGSTPMTISVQHFFVEMPEAEAIDALTGQEDVTAVHEEVASEFDLDPTLMPVADVDMSAVVIDNVEFGQWRFSLRPTPEGTRVESIQGAVRGARVAGSIDWLKQATGNSSHFVGSVESRDVAGMLRQWDFPPVLESDQMRSLLDVSWAGSPIDFDPYGLHGNASLEIGESRFPKTDSKTSALRVLGVFNLGTLSRRMRLDFTDLYKKGLICDNIGGDFQLDGASLQTSNLVIKSPSAEFRVKGQADIKAGTLDHQVEVTLPVSSNLYVGCLAGPTACAGIFVVERLWGNKLEKMTTLGYQVTGTWEEPEVKEVQGMFERKK